MWWRLTLFALSYIGCEGGGGLVEGTGWVLLSITLCSSPNQEIPWSYLDVYISHPPEPSGIPSSTSPTLFFSPSWFNSPPLLLSSLLFPLYLFSSTSLSSASPCFSSSPDFPSSSLLPPYTSLTSLFFLLLLSFSSFSSLLNILLLQLASPLLLLLL